MTRQVVFRPIAQHEFEEAVAWYEGERLGLGLEFIAAVDQKVALIARQPALFRQVRGPIRRAVVRRFPYTIHFVEEPERIVVLAVFHASRDPATLRLRS
jgi:plasmid stabilization system protein ParE